MFSVKILQCNAYATQNMEQRLESLLSEGYTIVSVVASGDWVLYTLVKES